MTSAFTQGLSDRLFGSSLNFEKKLRLCRNAHLALCLSAPKKNEIILDWILMRLEEKNSLHLTRYQLELWSLLELLSRSKSFESLFYSVRESPAEVLTNIVLCDIHDKDLQNVSWKVLSRTLESKSIMYSFEKQSELYVKFLTHLLTNYTETQRNMFEKLNEFLTGSVISLGSILSLLPTLCFHSSTNSSSSLFTLLSHLLFSKALNSDWKTYLLSLTVNDLKPPESIVSIVQILTESKDLISVLSSVFSAAAKSESTFKDDSCLFHLFIILFYMIGDRTLESKIIHPKSITLSKDFPFKTLPINLRLNFFKRMTQALREDNDLKCEILPQVSFLKWLQHLIKDLLLAQREQEDDKGVINEDFILGLRHLISLNSLVIEPLIGQFTCYVLFHPSEYDASSLFQFLMMTYSKLRQFPKYFSKLLLAYNDAFSVSMNINKDALLVYGTHCSQLPLGQTLELWRTFLYHCEEGKKSSELHCIIDTFLSTFLEHSCIFQNSIPSNMMDKILHLIERTKVLEASIPKTLYILIDVSYLLYSLRKIKVDVGEPKDLIQRFKRNETFGFKTVEPLNLTYDQICSNVSYFISKGEEGLLKEISSKILLSPENNLVEFIPKDNNKLHSALVDLIKRKLSDYYSFLDETTTLNTFWKTEKNDKKSFSISSSPPINLLERILLIYEQLPLEHCDASSRKTIILTCLQMLDLSLGNRVPRILTRSLEAPGKPTDVFRSLHVGHLLIKLSSNSLYDLSSVIRAVITIALKFTKTLEDIYSVIDELSSSLSNFNSSSGIETVICLMEKYCSLTLAFKSKNYGEEKKNLVKKSFVQLSKGLFKVIKTLNCENDVIIYNIMMGLSYVLSYYITLGKKTKLAKWTPYIGNFFHFAIESSKAEALVFIQTLVKHIGILGKEGLPLNFEEYICNFLLSSSSSFSSDCVLIEDLLQITDETLLKAFMSHLYTESKNEAQGYKALKIWKSIVSVSHVSPQNTAIRKEYLDKILPFYHQLVVRQSMSLENGSLLSMLALEASLLNAEKPLLSQESEARCLITSLTLDLKGLIGHPHFVDAWTSVHDVVFKALKRRTQSLVSHRVPLIMSLLSKLNTALLWASESSNKNIINNNNSNDESLTQCSSLMTRLLEIVSQMKEHFARVTPFLLATIFQDFQKLKVIPEVKANVMNGVYKLFDLCDEHSKDFMLRTLPESSKELCKETLENYTKYYKYSGRI